MDTVTNAISSYVSKLLSSWKLRIKSTGELRTTLVADMLFFLHWSPFSLYYMPILKIYYHKVYLVEETTIPTSDNKNNKCYPCSKPTVSYEQTHP